MSLRKAKVVVMPGDGIGPEVTAEAVKVLLATGADIEFFSYSVGGKKYIESGDPLPEEVLYAVEDADAVLLGALGHKDTPYEIPRKVLVYLRLEKDAFANIRPLKTYPNMDKRCENMDIIIIRDNSEGFTLKQNGRLGESEGTDKRVITNYGAKRIIKIAFDYAESKSRRKVTCVDQSNWLYSDKLFRKSFMEVSDKYPSINRETLHVDVAAMMLARSPETFDVIVTPNIYGDILSGVGISHITSVGMAPSACIGEKFAYFEPVHGTAWDIAGQKIANPIASILSGKLLLEWIGYEEEAWLVEAAVKEVLAEGKYKTPDIGGKSSTSEVGTEIARKVIEMTEERKKYQDTLSQLNEALKTQVS